MEEACGWRGSRRRLWRQAGRLAPLAGASPAALNKAGGFWYNTSTIMGIRLATFDYKSPYFYMVTLKAEKGALPFARIRKEPLPEMARQPTRKELYDRCHEMGDVVLEGLARL